MKLYHINIVSILFESEWSFEWEDDELSKLDQIWIFKIFPTEKYSSRKNNEYSIEDPITRDFLYYSSFFEKNPNERYGATNLWDYHKLNWF